MRNFQNQSTIKHWIDIQLAKTIYKLYFNLCLKELQKHYNNFVYSCPFNNCYFKYSKKITVLSHYKSFSSGQRDAKLVANAVTFFVDIVLESDSIYQSTLNFLFIFQKKIFSHFTFLLWSTKRKNSSFKHFYHFFRLLISS